MIIEEVKLKNRAYVSRHGLAEALVRRRLVRAGFDVFRGIGFFGPEALHVEYPVVIARYERLESLLRSQLGFGLFTLRSVLHSPKGMPDFLCYKDGRFLFVEVKLEHEPIKKHQLAKMELLERFGFETKVVRVKQKPYRIISDSKKVMVRQKRFRRKVVSN